MCVGFLQRIYGSLVSTHQELSPSLVEEELVSACAEVQGKESRLVRKDEKRMHYACTSCVPHLERIRGWERPVVL